MKDKIIGVYEIGSEQAQLVLCPDLGGGSFWVCPEKGAVPRIRVGWSSSWQNVVSILVHEAFEMQMMRLRCRWAPAPDHSRDNGDYLFVMNHVEFSDVCGRVSIFLTDCMPELARQWRIMGRKMKRRKS